MDPLKENEVWQENALSPLIPREVFDYEGGGGAPSAPRTPQSDHSMSRTHRSASEKSGKKTREELGVVTPAEATKVFNKANEVSQVAWLTAHEAKDLVREVDTKLKGLQ